MMRFVKRLFNFHYQAMKADRAFNKLLDYLESKPTYLLTEDEKRQLQIISEIIVLEDILDLHLATTPYQEFSFRLEKSWLLEEVRSLCSEELAF